MVIVNADIIIHICIMNRFKLILFTSLLLSSIISFSQSNCKRIGFVYPTVKNLDKLDYLVSSDLIKVGCVEVLGVFHASQIEEIQETKESIDNYPNLNLSLKIIEGEVDFSQLFHKNTFSSDFNLIFKETDAMLFFGGPDIPPSVYGKEVFLTTHTYPKERTWEISFLNYLIGGKENKSPLLSTRNDYLVLGICLGMQEMNVSNGGTLKQDIPMEIYKKTNYESIVEMPINQQHRNYLSKINDKWKDSTGIVFHTVKPLKISSNFLPSVASIHHQCVDSLGSDFKVTYLSNDELVVEGIEHINYKNVYGVQFHPEIADLYQNKTFKTPGDLNYKLDEQSLNFHKQFWTNFSERLNNQIKHEK